MFIKFQPLLKQTIWGGEKIIPFKQLDSRLDHVGESWEISGVKDNETVVREGPYAGMTLGALTAQMEASLVGAANFRRFGTEFPLLIKFIDACDDLSIQVHPTDEIARRQGKPRGKTEMWYIMKSDEGARLYSGLRREITPEEYKKMVENDTITDALAQYEVKEGDVFFLPAGRIHAIGSGCFLAEIQQTSDVTYRIYDYGRRDKDGRQRQLHTKEAAECINYQVENDYRTHYAEKKDQGVTLVKCPYFSTTVYDLTREMTIDYSALDSFVILIGMSGSALLTDEDGETTTLKAGETVLVPATTRRIRVTGQVKMLETFVES